MRALIPALILAASLSLPALADQKKDHRCDIYGEGFTYVESSGACVKISGDIRAGYSAGHKAKGFDTQGRVTLDARKQTDLGELRVVVSPEFSQ
jgi:hypothetical protein